MHVQDFPTSWHHPRQGTPSQHLGTGTAPSPGEPYRAFVPAPLPPAPPLEFTADDHDLVERASRALGRLDGLTALVPDTSLFIHAYVRKEAVVSSQIEGTQSSFADLLLYESDQAPGVPLEDVREVSDYVAALQHGLERSTTSTCSACAHTATGRAGCATSWMAW